MGSKNGVCAIKHLLYSRHLSQTAATQDFLTGFLTFPAAQVEKLLPSATLHPTPQQDSFNQAQTISKNTAAHEQQEHTA